MHIETLGKGPDLVLIHGWAMHGGVFAPLTRLLRERFRLHIVDLPGHGYSRDDATTLDPAQCAQHLLAVLPRAVWLGWSFGGLIALHAALAQPGAVRGLAVIAASPCFVTASDWPHGVAVATFAGFDAGLRRDYRATINRFLALETMGSDGALAELRELRAHVFERGEPALVALEQGLRVLETADLRMRLPQLAMPSLWIAGRRDRLVPAAALRWATRHCPQSHFVEIASGHAPFVAHAAETAKSLIDFTGSLPA
ncbi:MAG: pimeloyl-ACP methyl ester esterase BioH [Rudaea sp.]